MTIRSGVSHSFDTGVAAQFGIECAIIFNHIVFWCRTNASKCPDQCFIEDKYWMFETQKQMANIIGYLSEDQIQRSIKKLLDAGVLLKGHFGKNCFDRICWYTVADQSLLALTNHNPLPPKPGSQKPSSPPSFQKSFTKPQNCGMHSATLRDQMPQNCGMYKEDVKEDEKKETTYYPHCTSAREGVVVVSSNEAKKETPKERELTKPPVVAPGRPHVVPQLLAPQQLITSYQCLDSMNLTQQQKLKISQSYSEQVVAKSVEYILAQSKPPRNLGGYLDWACKAPEVQNIRDPQDVFNANRDFARQVERNVVFNPMVRFEALSKACEFVYPTSCKQPDVFKYDDPGFQAKVKHKMKEFEFTLKQIENPNQIGRAM